MDHGDHSRRSVVRTLAISGALALAAALPARTDAQIGIPAFQVDVTEDFNTLANSGSSSTLPLGWAISKSGANANGFYTAGTGSSNTGDTYSFGSTGALDRALGGLQSGTLIPIFGASFINNTSSTINVLEMSYVGEQWRLGTAGRADRIDFQYSLDATSLTTGTWIDDDGLDFSSPSTTTVGALDGNLAANRTLRFSLRFSLGLQPGATMWIRWIDFNASGWDDGLSVDDFRIRAIQDPLPTKAGTWGRIKAMYR